MSFNQCFLKKNACYIAGAKQNKINYLVLHSTGANNPWLKRYIPPDDIVGTGWGTHWDTYAPGGNKVCVHGFIGKAQDGSVWAYQTLPWDMVGWHAGQINYMGSIGVEMCEDGLNDADYLDIALRRAAELFAMLCREYSLDPYKAILSHKEAAQRGIATNHADPDHWLGKFGITMDGFRLFVDTIMKKEDEDDMTGKEIYEKLTEYLRSESDIPDWAQAELQEAVGMGITDGTRPMELIPRYQAAIMAKRAAAERAG